MSVPSTDVQIDDFCAEGTVLDRTGPHKGWIRCTGGDVKIGIGTCPHDVDIRGTILTDVLNMHTHCADYGLDIPPGLSLEELVAPPDGLKHRYLLEQSNDALAHDIRRFSKDSRRYGSAAFVDFREGGADGCRLLRRSAPGSVILGRPMSKEFDAEEIDDILSVADGIGISSISDMDCDYIEQIADMVRDRRMIFAIHASERVREDIDFILSLDPAFVVHMCEATETDMLKCAEAEVPVVMCPTSNRYFGKEPPLAKAIQCGVDIALGTDNGMLCPPDLISETFSLANEAERLGLDPDTVLRAPARLYGKILNAVGTHRGASNPAPVTILTSAGERICIEREKDGIQQDPCADRRKRIY